MKDLNNKTTTKEEDDVSKKKSAAAAALSIKEAAAAVSADPRRTRLEEWRKTRTSSPAATSCSSSVSSSVTTEPAITTPAHHRRNRSTSTSSSTLSSLVVGGEPKMPPQDTKASLLRKASSSLSASSNVNMPRNASASSLTLSTPNHLKKNTSKITPKAKTTPNRPFTSPRHQQQQQQQQQNTTPSSHRGTKYQKKKTKSSTGKKQQRQQQLPTIHSSFKHHPHAFSSSDDENIIATITIESEGSQNGTDDGEDDDCSSNSSSQYSSQSSPATTQTSSSFFGNLFWSSIPRSNNTNADSNLHKPIVLEATAVDDITTTTASTFSTTPCSLNIDTLNSSSTATPHVDTTNQTADPNNNNNNNNTKQKLSSFIARSKRHFPKPSSSPQSQSQQTDQTIQNLTNSLHKSQSQTKSLENQLEQKQIEYDALVQRLSSLGLEKNQLQLDAALHHEEMTNVKGMNETLQTELDSAVKEKWEACESKRIMEERVEEFDVMQNTVQAIQREMETKKQMWEKEKEDTKKEYETLVEKLKFDLRVMRIKNATLAEDNHGENGNSEEHDENDAAVLNAKLELKDEKIMELESKLTEGETLRRKMHNEIQELRGNVRVYVRTRPFLQHDSALDNTEEKKEELSSSSSSSPITILPNGNSLTITNKEKEEQLFQLDKVFDPTCTQQAVFDEVSDFVQSALDGYHVCLFSYGQTGSGKTHTMQGSGSGDLRGIIPRAVELILDKTSGRKGWKFELKASFLEIYNEELKDLLVAVPGSPWEDATNENAKKMGGKTMSDGNKKLAIKKNANGRTFVKNLRHVSIDTTNSKTGMSTLEEVMTCAARSRSVAFTHMNATSSRSHSVFALDICGTNEENGLVVHGTLNLCDLAGSERLDRSNHDLSTPEGMARLKETQSINKSLSTLGDVFGALSNGSSHIPYRNSKLTYLLQDCLGGDGKALMFVNLSPTEESSFESLCSLRFAQRVNQVELGRATRDVSQGSSGGGVECT